MVDKLIGVIGGSGLYSMQELDIVEKISVQTPFGEPSDDVIIGRIEWSAFSISSSARCRAFYPTFRNKFSS